MKLGQKLAIGFIRASLHFRLALSTKWAVHYAFSLFCTPFRKSRKKKPDIFLRATPLTLEFQQLVTKGFLWTPEKPVGKRLLIAHGFESTAFNFDRYISPMRAEGWEIIAFDALAHGNSGGKTINVLEYAQFLAAIHQRFGPFDGLLAHSFGGLAAGLWQETLPSEMQIPKMVWIAPATETVSAIHTFCNFLQVGPSFRKAFFHHIESISGHPPSWFSLCRAVDQIHSSILWIHDEQDEVTPLVDVQPVIKKNIPTIQFLLTKNLGHRQIYRDNKVKKAVVHFLTS